MKNVYFLFGRFNPPTIAHKQIIEEFVASARKDGYAPILFVSTKNGDKKNPLTFEEKVDIIKSLNIHNLIINEDKLLNNIIAVYRHFHQIGVERVKIVCGKDRYDTYKAFADRNKTRFVESEVFMSNDKRLEKDGEEISATSCRQSVLDGDYDKFKRLFASDKESIVKQYFGIIKQRLDVLNTKKKRVK